MPLQEQAGPVSYTHLMEIVKADNLVKYYGSGDSLVKAVDHVGLSVRKGEFVAVVGTSGSGKTTLLNLLGGLDYADEGTVLVDGQDITRMKEEELTVFRRRNIGFVFQSYNLVTVLNVEKNITLPIRLDGNRVDEEDVYKRQSMAHHHFPLYHGSLCCSRMGAAPAPRLPEQLSACIYDRSGCSRYFCS